MDLKRQDYHISTKLLKQESHIKQNTCQSSCKSHYINEHHFFGLLPVLNAYCILSPFQSYLQKEEMHVAESNFWKAFDTRHMFDVQIFDILYLEFPANEN